MAHSEKFGSEGQRGTARHAAPRTRLGQPPVPIPAPLCFRPAPPAAFLIERRTHPLMIHRGRGGPRQNSDRRPAKLYGVLLSPGPQLPATATRWQIIHIHFMATNSAPQERRLLFLLSKSCYHRQKVFIVFTSPTARTPACAAISQQRVHCRGWRAADKILPSR